ncbi:TolB family protein [Hymenobacter profundi]|uniref:Uncharacterized protein n=1 Tax=Hymenobacter profundi TaxID=1982110 RepID=A0ABS6X4Z4_9BACT|nr:hypothetical protein [Hymenobacter profundi]MBW3130774.1 hypothetical protein [Hymenobacter profundi]
MRLLLCFLVCCLLPALPGASQSLPVLDQNPPDLRWQEVRTPHFRLLYPRGLDSAAQRTAHRLEQVQQPGTASLGVVPRHLPIVLQNQTTISNAFVTFLPRHAEFFTTPEQGQALGTMDWLDGLVLHEYRHVGQFDKARQGIGRLLVPLLGDQGLGVGAVGVPQWFFEGDAVGSETALSRSGRGRVPYFGVGMRANRLAGRHFGYQKAVNGSFRDNVPNWYVLGYYMTSYLKTHYGPNVWASVLDKYYQFPFYPFSFSNSIRRTTGLRVEDLYQRTMHELDSTWQAGQQNLVITPGREFRVKAEERVFTQYEYPQYVTDSSVLAMKTGLGTIAQLVLLRRHAPEQKVFVQGLTNVPEMLSVGGGKVVWPEYRYDPRWRQRVYSELRILDLSTGRLTHLTKRRYTAAALSPDGRQLVVTLTDSSYHHSLRIVDVATGREVRILPNPRNDFYQQPRWLPDGRVVAVALRRAGKTLTVLDPATGQEQDLLPVANINLTNPQPWGEFVLYNSPQSGIDNIYAVSRRTGQTWQVTSRPVGAYHAAVSPDGQRLAFHEFQATGSRVLEMPLDTTAWRALPAPATEAVLSDPYAAQLSAQEPAAALVRPLLVRPDSAATPYPVRPYSPLRHAFNVFGWGVVQSPTGNSVNVGVRSQDLLNTTQAQVGVGYNQAERTANVFGGLSYQGRYPVLDLSVEHGGRNTGVYVDRRTPLDSLVRDRWNYTRLTVGGRLPLTLTRSKYLQALTLSAYYLREQVNGYDLPLRYRTDPASDRPVNAVQTSFSYARQLKLSARDVAPRWGGTLLATWRTTPFGAGLNAAQFGTQASVYLPGIGRHHAIRLRGGYQWQQQREYQFSSSIFFPRGIGYVSFDRLWVGTTEYALPLAFVHWAVGRVLYVQRLRATAFMDVAHGESRSLTTGALIQRDYRTVGVDGAVLFNVLHLRTPFELGARFVYNPRTRQASFSPLVFNIQI